MPLPSILSVFETHQKQFFHIFGAKEKNKKKNFQEKMIFIGKNRFLLEKSAIFLRFFTSDFSFPKSFPIQPKTDFSPKNRPKKMIFLSLYMCVCIYIYIYIYKWILNSMGFP